MTVLDPELFVRERKRQRLSVVDMSDRSGLRTDRIGDIEKGADATLEEVEAIASALGVAVHDIDGSE